MPRLAGTENLKSFCVVFAAVALAAMVQAQEQPPLPTNPTSASEPSLLPSDFSLVPLTPSQRPVAPSAKFRLAPPDLVEPILPPLNFQKLPEVGLPFFVRVFVKKFRFEGNHVYSDKALAKVVEKYQGHEITPEDLEEARQALTLYYVNHGYINSGAVLPDQNFEKGEIIFRIVEGKLTGINLGGNFWFRSYWLRNELRRAAGRPLNFNHLKEGLQLLRQVPTIAQINAELKPGGVPGESLLDVTVKDTQPFRLGLEFSNKRPPSVGSEIVEVQASDLNLTGHNDPLEIRYGIAHTTKDGFDFSGLENIEGTYSFPVTPWETTMQVHGSKSDSSIIEAPFTTLDIKSKLEQYGALIRQPLYQTLNQEFAISLGADKRHSETFLLDRPFSLSPGAVNGVQDVFVVRFTQEFVNRSQVHVLALRSTFNLGITAFGSTVNGTERDGRFFTWLGQAQYVRRLWNTDNLLVLRLNGQVSNSPLLSLEQFAVGGASSVRGYRENELLRDNGVFGSIEIRIPVIFGKEHSTVLSLAPFFDVGSGWDTLDTSSSGNNSSQQQNQKPDRRLETIPSAGIGLIFSPTKYFHAQIYWGYAFNRELLVKGRNLQDYGIHFTLSANLF